MKVNKVILSFVSLILLGFSSVCGQSAKVSTPDSLKKVKAETQVVIEHKQYTPDTITVAKGATITWTDKQSIMPHTVTSEKGLFDSGNMHKGDTWSHVFNETGTFNYYCTHHKNMRGTVIVK